MMCFNVIGAQVGQGIEPLLGSAAAVKCAFLFFGRFADFLLHLGIGDDNEGPGLLVGSGWGCTGSSDGIFDEFERHRFAWKNGALCAACAFDLSIRANAAAGSRGRVFRIVVVGTAPFAA